MWLTLQARVSDAAAIADVYVETWRTTYAGMVPDHVLVGMSASKIAASWRQVILRAREIVLVAINDNGVVVGFGSAGRNRDRSSSFAGEVYTLYVKPDYQNQGLGRALLVHLFNELDAAGHKSAVIWVLAANPSRFFYHNMGGRQVGERIEKLWGSEMRELGYGFDDLLQAKPDAGP